MKIVGRKDFTEGAWQYESILPRGGKTHAIAWKIGCSSHDGYYWTNWPRLVLWRALAIRQIARWILRVFPVDTKRLEVVNRELWGAWWYGSESPTFGWIGWIIAARWALRNSGPTDRQSGRSTKGGIGA